MTCGSGACIRTRGVALQPYPPFIDPKAAHPVQDVYDLGRQYQSIAAGDATASPRGSAARLVSWRHTCPPTAGAAIAADNDQQHRRALTRRLVHHQSPGHAVARRSLTSATATPMREVVGLDDPAGQHARPGSIR